MRGDELVLAGFVMLFLGMLLVAAGMLIQAGKQGQGAEVRGGGVVLIGPLPVVFGSDTQSVKMVVLLTLVLILVVYLLFYRGWPQ